jgi:hypothetical protein
MKSRQYLPLLIQSGSNWPTHVQFHGAVKIRVSAAQVADLHQFLPIWTLRGPTTPLAINRFRIAALSLDDHAAEIEALTY